MTRSTFIFLGGIFALVGLFAPNARAAPPVPTQVVFSQVQTSTITVDWQATTGTTIQFLVELSSSAFVTPLSSNTVLLSSTFTALDVNILYFAHVQSIDTVDGNSSAFTASVSTYTLANPPLSLSTTAISETEVDLTWDGNGNPFGTIFSIERSTDGVLFGALGTTTGTTYQDLTVVAGTISYRVQALNGNNVPTAYTNVVALSVSEALTELKTPGGFWAQGQTNGSITYQWRAVTERQDGSALVDLAGYRIWSSSNILAPPDQWVLVTTVPVTTWSTVAVPGSVAYYAIQAVDANGIASALTHAIDDSASLVNYFIGADGFTRATVPQIAANILRQENNTFGTDVTLQWAEVSAEETGSVVRSMTLEAIADATGSEVSGFAINSATLVGIIGYSVSNGQIVAGAPRYATLGTAKGSAKPLQSTLAPASFALISAAQASSDLSLFWYDGVEWTKTTGSVDTTNNAVSFTGSRIGRFQIRVASHASTASQIALTNVYPRIMTPNGDGWNDKTIFEFDNPQLLPVSGKIYDISGGLVTSLKPGPNPDSTLEWDGKDSGGKVVPGGIYVYQVDLSGTSQTGTIVVAR